ncbi:hypothetical protein QBC46DRAFT_265837 [Diplogelasinospora grovesii]|uniref:Zonadhesin n=1 Tax=Diplogelasinospora grovesii TaxID=303347 RepID=A0AAN6N4T7_9PEZI|nr:hypothetical protein QBC46DRAFT_265837 [Diplogelasinospora grovesii]
MQAYHQHHEKAQPRLGEEEERRGGPASLPHQQDDLNYRPSPLTWPFVVSLTVVILGLIATVAVACFALPPETDRSVIPSRPSQTTTMLGGSSRPVSTASTGGAPRLRVRVQNPMSYAQNGTVIVTPTSNPGGDAKSTDGTMTPWMPHSSNYAQDGSDTVTGPATSEDNADSMSSTSSLPLLYTGSPDDHASVNSVTITPETTPTLAPPVVSTSTGQTTLDGVVSTVTGHTTLDGVVSTVTGQTTLNGVTSTFTGVTTDSNGVSTTFTATTMLNGVVSSISAVTTMNGVVSSFSAVTTLNGVVSEITAVTTIGGPSYVTAKVVTLTDSNGVPTATFTSTPPPMSTPTVITLTDSNGVPTATLTTSVLATPVVTTLTDSKGVPTATVTEYPAYPSSPPQPALEVYYISKGQYFIGFFLPTVIGVVLTIPIRMIDLSAKQFQPWHELTHPHGASAHESLCLQTGGIYGLLTSVRSLFGGQALVFLSTMLTLCSVFLVPISSEAIALKVHGSCSETSFKGCAMTLGVFLGPAKATIALLGFMAVTLVFILVVLRKGWQSGVATNPWTIAGVASLSTNPDVRALFTSLPTGRERRIPDSQLLKALEGRTFKLGYFFNQHGVPEYGITIHNQDQAAMHLQKSDAGSSIYAEELAENAYKKRKAEHHLPFLMLTYKWRLAFLLLLTGVMVVVLYYNNTGGDTPFERFMDTQSFGVRALFTLVGIGITFFWSSFFTSLATLSPYYLLSQRPQPAERSILLSPSLNAFTGIFRAIQRRHVFLVIVAFTAILSEFMPILLNNVPFRITQTWVTHLVCTWLAVAILCVMWLVVVASFFISWPHMPVDPSTIAGAMYYVCDSWMLYNFEGLGVLDKKERDWKIKEMRLKFEFGDIMGVSGKKRIGVDGLHVDMNG